MASLCLLQPFAPPLDHRTALFFNSPFSFSPLFAIRLTASAASDGEAGPTTTARPASPPPPTKKAENSTVFVGNDGVPLEGVIQFEKPDVAPSKLISWAQVGLLAGGDVLCLLMFSAIGRFSHGFPVLDFETFCTADPLVAGWFLVPISSEVMGMMRKE